MYSFAATAGQQVTLKIGLPPGGSATSGNLSLFDPDGNRLQMVEVLRAG